MLKAIPQPKKYRRDPLASLGGLTREASRIYRAMKRGKIRHNEGRSLIWALSQLRAMVEAQALADIEVRLEQLAHQSPHARESFGGYLITDEEARLPS